MQKSDQQLGLIGFLFALAIGFWGTDMVTYYQEGAYSRITISEASLEEMKTNALPKTVVDVLKSFTGKEFKTKEDREAKLKTALSDFLDTKRDEYIKIIISAASAAADEKPGVAAIINEQSLKKMKANGLPDTVVGALKSFEGEEFKTKEDLKAKLESDLYFSDTKRDEYIKIIISAASAAADEKPGVAAIINEQSLKKMKANGLPDTVASALKPFEGEEFKTEEDLKAKLGAVLSDFLDAKKNKYTKIIINAAAKFSRRVPIPTVWVLTMVAGMVFFADIVCIMWWYAKYIYKIQTTVTLQTYFLDFSVCAMFNVAANGWTTMPVFLSATLGGSLLLFGRFINLYYSQEANDTDRRILRTAGSWLIIAVVLSLASLGVLEAWLPDRSKILDNAYVHPMLVVALSLIGICVTIIFREKLRVSADIHESSTLPFVPMNLHWPSKLADDKDSINRIADDTLDGLKRFRALFQDQGKLKHDRLLSRVHPEGDLHVQSYILAIPSWAPDKEPKVKSDEVRNKAFMVGMSHWIDDLVDGRGELKVYKKLKKEKAFGLAIEGAEGAFSRIYKDIIENYTDKNSFYKKLLQQIEDSAPTANRKYLFFSLNRVAVGAAIFGPKVREGDRKKLLENHNTTIVELIREEKHPPKNDDWYREVAKFIQDMRAEPKGLGRVLLGLTTKTVQEMAMASEKPDVCFARSVLYSLLYAPLLYFHDRDGELEHSEMVPLELLDVSYVAIFPWLRRTRELIESNEAPEDPEHSSRLEQLKMAFHCFSPKLPQVAKSALADIYNPPAQIVTERKTVELLGTASVKKAAQLMAEKHIGAVLITNNGRLEGIFTERDLTTRVIGEGLDPGKTKLAKVMTKNLDTIAPEATAREALAKINQGGYRHLPVMDGDRLVGIISTRDLYQVVKQQLEDDIKNRDSSIFRAGDRRAD